MSEITKAKAELARRMAERRRELIARPLAEIWEELAAVAMDGSDHAPSSRLSSNTTYCVGCANDWDRSADGASHDSGSSIVPCTATPIEIRPLKWEELEEDRGDGLKEVRGWESDSGFNMFYEIDRTLDGYSVSFDYKVFGQFEDPDAAKACAQAHYDRKISEAIAAGMPRRVSAMPSREQIGRALYECEKKRGEHADAVMKGISAKASDALLMEPWEECKDSFLGDADAVLSLFGSAQDMTKVQAVAAAILPVVDRVGTFTSEDRALEIAKLAITAIPRSAATSAEAMMLADEIDAASALETVGKKWRRLPVGSPKLIVAALRQYAAPTTSPEPSTCKDSLHVQPPEPDAVREALQAVAKLDLWRDHYPDGPDIVSDHLLQRWFTPDQVRAARAALARDDRGE